MGFFEEDENVVYAWCHICRGVIHDCTEVVLDGIGRRTNYGCFNCSRENCALRSKKISRVEALKKGLEIQELPCLRCLEEHPGENLYLPVKTQILTQKKKRGLDCPSYDSWLRNVKEDRLDCPGRSMGRGKNLLNLFRRREI